VREGAPLLQGTPLGMRRRDERLGKSVKCWDYTKDERKAWDSCQSEVKSLSKIKNKRNFYWRDKKEDITLLESAPLGQNSIQTQVWVRWSDKDHY
jgi:hypothetical protein